MKLLRLLLAMFACTGLVAGQSSDPWAALSKHAGKKVTISTIDGQRHSGKLLRIEEGRIVLQNGGAAMPIARSSVQRITRDHTRNKAAWIAGLSAAGLGAGFAVGFKAFEDATFAERKIGTVALAGAGAGAAIGYLVSRGGRKQEVVYEAP